MEIDKQRLPELAALLVAQSPDASIFADKDGSICLWNAAASAIFGFSKAQTLGQNLDIIIPEKLRAAHWRGFDAAMASGTTKHHGKALPTKAICADGSQIYVEMSFAVICDADQQVIGSLAQAREITERYLKTKADHKRLKALERAAAKG